MTSQEEEEEGRRRRRGEEREKVDEGGQTAPKGQEHVLKQPKVSNVPQQTDY